MKNKLTIPKQVQHMKDKGITFNLRISEQDAESFITNNTYYFKIKSYCKNYNKNKLNKYVNLDFEYLKELSILDMHLRKMILHLCLNIEHTLRIIINEHISNNSNEDGYKIVQNFMAHQVKVGHPINLKSSLYTHDLYEKHNPNFASWNFMELLCFGDLINFYSYYFNLYDTKLKDLTKTLFAVQRIRNASAHNNCLLINLTKSQIGPSYKTKAYLRDKGLSKAEVNNKLSIAILNDFATLLFCFKKLVKSSGVIKATFEELDILIKRFNHHIDYFDKNQKLQENLKFFEKLVDFFR